MRGEIRKLEEEFLSLKAGSGSSEQIILGKKQEIEQIREQISCARTRMEELEAVIAGHTARKKQWHLSRRDSLPGARN